MRSRFIYLPTPKVPHVCWLPRLDASPLSYRTEPDQLNGAIWRCECGTCWTLHYHHALDYRWKRTSRWALRKLKRQ